MVNMSRKKYSVEVISTNKTSFGVVAVLRNLGDWPVESRSCNVESEEGRVG